jgi:hypothetical protein
MLERPFRPSPETPKNEVHLHLASLEVFLSNNLTHRDKDLSISTSDSAVIEKIGSGKIKPTTIEITYDKNQTPLSLSAHYLVGDQPVNLHLGGKRFEEYSALRDISSER